MYTSGFYRRSPIIFQNVLLSLKAIIRKLIRENGRGGQFFKIISKHEFDKQKLSEFSKKQLSTVLQKSCEHVDFYKQLNLTDKTELSKFPYISKVDLKAQADAFISCDHKGFVVKGSTSGTTGTPLTIPQNLTSVLREQIFVFRHLKWAGYQEGDKRAWIRGDAIVPLEQKQGPFWRFSYFENMILLSSYHLTYSALPLYINAMVDYGVDIIQTFPSSIVTLAKYLDVKDEYYPGKLKSIITSSNLLSVDDKQLVEKRFNCPVFDWYGLFERVAAIAGCEHGRHHILTDYSHVELMDAGDGRHEIVGTNFNNSLYPLIRYKTGDHIVLSDEETCPCGRVFPLVDHLEGRVGEYLMDEDGKKVHTLNHILKGISGLIATQFLQRELNEIKILVVVDSSKFDSPQQSKLIEKAKECLGKSLNVVVEAVDSIPTTKNGKTRKLICEIKELSDEIVSKV